MFDYLVLSKMETVCPAKQCVLEVFKQRLCDRLLEMLWEFLLGGD